jgi:hypothetical protein
MPEFRSRRVNKAAGAKAEGGDGLKGFLRLRTQKQVLDSQAAGAGDLATLTASPGPEPRTKER